MKLNTYIPLLLLVFFTPAFLLAEWEKIDDFEYESADSLWDTWFLAGPLSEQAITEIIPDPVNPENRVLWYDVNTYQTTSQNPHAMVPKESTPVPDGSEATLYWRWFWTGVDFAAMMGFAVEPNAWTEPGEEGNETDRPISFDLVNWGDFRTVVNNQVSDFGPREENIYIYDNSGYSIGLIDAETPFEMVTGGWVEFWVHVNNTPGATGLDEYSVYAKLPGQEQVRLSVPSSSDPNLLFDTALFRGQLDGELPRFRYVSYPGAPSNRPSGAPVYVDDIYMDYSGLNTTTPPDVVNPDTVLDFWNGLPVVPQGEERWVETPLLNWLGVDGDPWIWSDSLATWIYLPAYNNNGTWVYVQAPPGEPPTGDGETWNGLPVVTQGDGSAWVNAPLFNWIAVDDDPFLWSDSLSTWLYLPEYNAAGAWVYVLPAPN